MPRKLSDWLTTYEEYVADTESPAVFHRWVGLSTISAVLRKKVVLQLGRLTVYPNLYCILVGPPGARKSEAIKFGQRFLKQIQDIRISSDATTPEAFVQDLAGSLVIEQYPNGTIFQHCSLSIISREFEIFIGNRNHNGKMIAILTDVFDAPDDDWTYRVKHGKSDTIPSVYVNLLAATTPDSLASSLPIGAVGSGFTSRIMFIFAGRRDQKIPIPELSPETNKLEEALLEDLYTISRIAGTYQFSPEGREFWINWYNNYNEHDSNRICQEPSFAYWYERKPTQLLKVAQLIAASSSDRLLVSERHLSDSLKYIEDSEHNMGHAFSSVGRSTITSEVDMVLRIIEQEGRISEPALVTRLLKELDTAVFDNVIKTITRSGKVRREYTTADDPVWYVWIG